MAVFDHASRKPDSPEGAVIDRKRLHGRVCRRTPGFKAAPIQQ
jgi:hypothetical protein